jgi:hypothetical protein
MRKLILPGLLLLGGCAALPPVGPPPAIPASRQAVVAMELEYVQKFLAPATAYTLLPRCPQPAANAACSDPAVVAHLRAAEAKVHAAIYAARDLTDAAPDADASTLLANARASLDAAEAILPKTGAKP